VHSWKCDAKVGKRFIRQYAVLKERLRAPVPTLTGIHLHASGAKKNKFCCSWALHSVASDSIHNIRMVSLVWMHLEKLLQIFFILLQPQNLLVSVFPEMLLLRIIFKNLITSFASRRKEAV